MTRALETGKNVLDSTIGPNVPRYPSPSLQFLLDNVTKIQHDPSLLLQDARIAVPAGIVAIVLTVGGTLLYHARKSAREHREMFQAK